MASFEEHSSISSKIDSSNAEDRNKNCVKRLKKSPLNGENNNINVNYIQLTMADKASASSTMENVIVENNSVESIDVIHSNSTFVQNITDLINSDAENVVSSTQETAIDQCKTSKTNNIDSTDVVNKNNATTDLPNSLANEKCTNSDQSHVDIVLSKQQNIKKSTSDENKCHLHIVESSPTKSKSIENGLYHLITLF